jgi:hypothetical protein
MATKTQRFRSSAERSGKKLPKKPKRPRRDDPVDTSKPGVSATDRKAGGTSTADRNRSKRAERKGGAKLEDSKEQPSRKSTRRSKGRKKRSSNLERRQIRRTRSPSARAARAQAKRR